MGRGKNEVHLLNDRAHKLGEVRKVVSRRPPHSLLQVFEKNYYLKKTVLRIAWLFKHRKTLHCMQHTELQRSSIASKSCPAMTELWKSGTLPLAPAFTPSKNPRASATRWISCRRSSASSLIANVDHLDQTLKFKLKWMILNVVQVAFHPSGACVGVATTGGTVRIYDIRQVPF